MDRKLKWFYRILIAICITLIAAHILIKAIIWPSALNKPQAEYRYSIKLATGALHTKYRHTTQLKQKLFNQANYLLTPAFTIIFVLLAIKLAGSEELFKEKD